MCDIDFTLEEDFQPPVMVYYSIDPFYQNYNTYILSKLCKNGTTDDPEDCGLKSRHVFNDTFVIVGRTIDTKDIAWSSDVSRYAEEAPDRDEHWIVWRRPSAMPNLRKVYGFVGDTMTKGTY